MSASACLCSIFLLTLFACLCAQEPPQFLRKHCGETNYTRNSTYSSNIKTLLSSLSNSSNTNFFSKGFHNNSFGDHDNTVSGYFLCRGDLSPEQCRHCIVFGVNDTLTTNGCPDSKEAMNYYDVCFIRYADRNILLDPPELGLSWWSYNKNVTAYQLDRYSGLQLSLLNEATYEAGNNSRKFAVKKANSTILSKKIYVMVQCVPVLSRDSCVFCLQRIIDVLPRFRIGARYLRSSCNLRYEHYPFYNVTFTDTLFPLPVSAPPQPALSAPPQPALSAPPKPGKGKDSRVIIIAIVVSISACVLLSVAVYYICAKKAKKTYDTAAAANDDEDDINVAGSLQFDFKVIEAATNKFSESNKLGKGGFGEVFKGTFPNELQVAVKRLSRKSRQGEREFKNEVVVVAKLQHINLVRLLGFCLERGEKILIFEFVPNKSLDYFLFDPTMQSQLNWTKRYNIIGGIARGILYLHQDSRLTIIHRDLKAGNILLDADMNPKVADFGMARIFEMDQTQANTKIIAGTYGYMAPEYAMYGQFSRKSDVFSFGVLVLEIISGKKNTNLFEMDGSVGNLITYAWRLWNNGSPLELVDPTFQQNYQENKIIKCIHIALLCVQEDAEDRPTMSAILQMLTTTSSITLSVPRTPGYLFRTMHDEIVGKPGPSTDLSSSLYYVDDTSITYLAPR